tara:strand:+ start:315 stop:566 length:252 start_codon:yes stop_codon:yes gene_type:complete
MKLKNNIKKEIIKILNKFGFVDKNTSVHFNFIESGFIDSLNLLKFITIIEKKYNIHLDNKYTSSKKFGELGNLIEKVYTLKKK